MKAVVNDPLNNLKYRASSKHKTVAFVPQEQNYEYHFNKYMYSLFLRYSTNHGLSSTTSWWCTLLSITKVHSNLAIYRWFHCNKKRKRKFCIAAFLTFLLPFGHDQNCIKYGGPTSNHTTVLKMLYCVLANYNYVSALYGSHNITLHLHH